MRILLSLRLLSIIFITGADPCTTVRDVSLIDGETAELYCHIDNEPSNHIYYRKVWSKLQTNGAFRQVYVYQKAESFNIDRPGRDEDGYGSRVQRTSTDVVKLNNVTEQDGGTYRCRWDVEPYIHGCVDVSATFNVTVIVKVSKVVAQVTPSTVGGRTTFQCTASGTSPITYTWQKAGVATSAPRWTDHGDGRATLSDIQRHDAGEYTCTANNEAKRPQTGAVIFVVFYPPSSVRFVSSLTGGTHLQNTQVTFTCTAVGGKPVPDVIIYRGADRLAAGKATAMLTSKLSQEDNGKDYVCKASSKGINGAMPSKAINYNVLFPPGIIELSSSSASSTQRENTHVTLKCTSDGGNPAPDVTVYRGRKSTVSGTSTAHLRIELNRTESGVQYVCLATSSGIDGEMMSNGYAYRVLHPPDGITLTYSPTNLTEVEQTSVTFTCRVDGGDPAPDVTIYRAGVKQTSAKSTARLTRVLTRYDHQVAFYCDAVSLLIDGRMKTNEIKYEVLFPHSVTVGTNVNPVTEGHDVTLTCMASGGNPNTVDSYRWQTPGRQTVTSSSNTLTLTNVQYMHAGLYTCYVTNAGGTASGELTLDVLYAPKEDKTRTIEYNIVAEYNQSVTFTLSVVANPLPTFTWLRKENSELPLLSKSKVFNAKLSSSLTIPNTRKEDTVAYICRVKNHIGNITFNYHLYHAAHPNMPYDIKIIYHTAVSVILQWLAGFNGGFTQTFSVMYRESGQPWPDEPQINNIADPGENRRVDYEVSGLKEEVTYDLRLRSVNARQTGENKSPYSASVTVSTKAKPTLPVVPFSVLRNSDSAEALISVMLPSGFYTDMNVKYCEQENVTACGIVKISMTRGGSRTKITGLTPGTLYTYTLQLYDKNTLVYSSAAAEAKPIISDASINSDTDMWIVGAVVGVLGAALLVILIVIVVFLRRRAEDRNDDVAHHSNGFNNDEVLEEDAQYASTSSPPAGIDVNKPKNKDVPETDNSLSSQENVDNSRANGPEITGHSYENVEGIRDPRL